MQNANKIYLFPKYKNMKNVNKLYVLQKSK